jgi:tetratricopeptide (TPR) repeat protein
MHWRKFVNVLRLVSAEKFLGVPSNHQLKHNKHVHQFVKYPACLPRATVCGRGAINAYSAALDLDPNQVALYSNRSWCYMALKQLPECEQDCSIAIDLLQKLQERLQDASDNNSLQEVAARSLRAANAVPGMAGTSCGKKEATAAATAAAADTARIEAAPTAFVNPAGDNGTTERITLSAPGLADLSGCTDESETDAGSSTSVPLPAGTSELAAPGAPSETAMKMRQQLVKLLARRAAAWVGLHQLSNAEQDLHWAIR